MKLAETMVVAGVALAVAGGASAQDVKVDYDKAANFGAIKTFSLKLGTSWGNQIGEKRVMDEFTASPDREGLDAGARGPGRCPGRGARRDRDEAQPQHLLLRRDGRVRLPGLGRHGRHGHGHHDRVRVHGGHAGGGHLRRDRRRACSGAASPRTSCRTRPTRTSRSCGKASDKLFKDFPPGSVKKK